MTTGVLLSPSPVFATPITFSFDGITDNTVNIFSKVVGGVTITINNPQCVNNGVNNGNINFRTSAAAELHMEPEFGTTNGDCGSNASLSASQFDIRFDKTVQFSSYESKAWDGGTYELVVNGATVSIDNTVGTSISATSSHAFASTPTLAAGTTATFKMVPLAIPSDDGDGGKLKSITVDYQNKSSQTISFGALGNKTFGDAPFNLSATAPSGLDVTYTATGNCTVAGTPVATVTLTGVGSCTITASQGGNGSYLAATEVVQTFSISEKVNTPVTSSTPPLPDYLGLFLQVDGTGHGKVTTDTGLSCHSSDCQVDKPTGDLKCNPQNCTQLEKTTSYVTLTTQADADSVFSSWGGNEDCLDGNVFMNGGKLCIAYFHRIYSLTVATQGPGQVMGYGDYNQQPIIDCGSTCQTSVSEGTKVSLQATPTQGMSFSGWSGDCGNNTQTPLTVEVNKEMKCLATFVTPTPPKSEDLDSSVVPTTPVATTPPVVTPPTPVVTTPVDTTPPTVMPPSVTVTTETPGNVPTTSPVTPVTTPVTTPPVETTTPVAVTTPAATTDQVPASPTPPVATTPPPVATTPPVVTPAPIAVTPLPVLVTIAGANYSCATTGNIGEVCNYGGREVTNLNVQTTGIVSNAISKTTVVNTGWVSNFHITATGQLRGGVVTGYIVNEGIMLDFEFKGMSIIGGTLGGVIKNNSRVGGYFQNVTLQANTKITGGRLKGTIKGDKKSPAVLEKVRVMKGSKLSGVTLGKGVVLEKGVVVEK